MSLDPVRASAATLAAAVKAGHVTAAAVTEAHLARIHALNPALTAYTAVTEARALEKAAAIDADRAAGRPLGPLAGVPFAVKNLFDIAGVVTVAGSKINRENAPAAADATLITRLEAAGAVLLGALNMGEYAYDFTGENAHDGASKNPHAPAHMSGGSSGGSGTAAAAGMATFTLGSDTNGSIRVPASLCGLFGFKATYGRFSRAGTFPFVSAFDHVGPLARSVADCALIHDACAGPDPLDPVALPHAPKPLLPVIEAGLAGLRLAIPSGHFSRNGLPEAFTALDTVAAALGVTRKVDLPNAARARGAAFLITTMEGAALHLPRLKTRPADFDPDVRDRLIAGAMLPGSWYVEAQKVRRRFALEAAALFREVDVLIAPATPCRAPLLGQKMFEIDGRPQPVRPNLGVFTQPFSSIGLPVLTVPLWTAGEALPIGVQIVAAAGREDLVLRVGRELERLGVVEARVAG